MVLNIVAKLHGILNITIQLEIRDCLKTVNFQSLRKFPRLYRTAGLVDWKNLPDQPGFH